PRVPWPTPRWATAGRRAGRGPGPHRSADRDRRDLWRTTMTLELIDSHCHIDGDRFDGDRTAVLERARAAGVVASVVVGGTSRTIEDLDRPVRICGDAPDLFPTVGVH